MADEAKTLDANGNVVEPVAPVVVDIAALTDAQKNVLAANADAILKKHAKDTFMEQFKTDNNGALVAMVTNGYKAYIAMTGDKEPKDLFRAKQEMKNFVNRLLTEIKL